MNKGNRIGREEVGGSFLNFRDHGDAGDDGAFFDGGFHYEDEFEDEAYGFSENEYPRFQKIGGRGGRSGPFDDDDYTEPVKSNRRERSRKLVFDEIWGKSA